MATLRPIGTGNPTPIASYYVHADHLGSPRAVTRPSDNAIMWQWDNVDPFGVNAANENPAGQGSFRYALRFPGQYYDAETGTHYNYFRDYDPSIGRYEQSDPIGVRSGPSTYGYVYQSPLRFVDPKGLAASETCEQSGTCGCPKSCDCPGGVWEQETWDSQFAMSFGAYFSLGRVNLTCKTNPSLKCRGTQLCIGGGATANIGWGWNLSGAVSGAQSACSLAGWGDWNGVLNWGIGNDQAPLGPGGSAGIGIGIGGGLAGIRCNTYRVSCNCMCSR